MDKIVGSEVRHGKDTVPVMQALNDVKFVGIYFGAHWAPPCRFFTKTLEEFYNNVNSGKKVFEVVFCSNDCNQDAFERNYAKMPWLAVPFEDEQYNSTLKQRYGINGIPTLVILDSEGYLIGYDGRHDIQNHGAESIEVWEKAKAQQTSK